MVDCPFLVLHYKRNLERKNYLERALARRVAPIYIDAMDQGEFPLDQVYRFDPELFIQQIMSVKDCMIAGTLKQGRLRDWPWAGVRATGAQPEPHPRTDTPGSSLA